MEPIATLLSWFSNYVCTLVLGVILSVVIYRYGTRKRRLLERVFPGIPGPKPLFLFGHAIDLMQVKGQIHTLYDIYYKKYGQMFKVNFFGSPGLSVSDPEMIKDIFVKKFDCFHERTSKFSVPPPVDKNVADISGQAWRRIRSTLSPSFSAHKLKGMVELINISCDTLVKKIDKAAESGESFDILSYQQNITFDAIMSIAFGVQTDAQNNPNDPIMQKAIRAMKPSTLNRIILDIVLPLIPYGRNFATSKLGERFFFKDMLEIAEIAQNVIEARKKSGEQRKDFLDLMLNANNPETNEDKALTDEEVVAQSVIFLLAGYETSSTTLSMTCYYLAMNPEIQQRLQQEIDSVCADEDEIPSYETVHEVPYLDMVISETLRLCPPGFMILRECNKECVIKGLKIPKDSVMVLPAYSIHRDPKIYPNPDKFDPERFSVEAKKSRDPYLYHPFGHGPRNCIGMRFAQMEMRMVLVRLLKKYSFVVTSDTKKPTFLTAKQTLCVDNVVLGVKKRTDHN